MSSEFAIKQFQICCCQESDSHFLTEVILLIEFDQTEIVVDKVTHT